MAKSLVSRIDELMAKEMELQRLTDYLTQKFGYEGKEPANYAISLLKEYVVLQEKLNGEKKEGY